MKLATWNVNGIRSAFNKGLSEFIENGACDFIFLQEVKASTDQLDFFIKNPSGYKSFFNPAIKKGYSGVGVYYKNEPESITTKLGLKRFDEEGRYVRIDYKDLTLINVYLPHGGRDKSSLDYKLSVYDYFLNYLKEVGNKPVIVAGDFNIAHDELDLSRPKENMDNIMFTPEERRKLDNLINLGFIDSYRHLNPKASEYSWFSYAFGAKEKNIGWRLDYFFVKEVLKKKLQSCVIQKDTKGSDHCPVILSILG